MKKVILVLLSILIILGLTGVILPYSSQPADAVPASRGVTRTVLAEDFTGTWCGYCPYAAGGLKQLQDEVGKDNFVVLAYHVGDTMETTQTAARDATYGVSGYPTVWIDGTIEEVGAGSVSSAYDRYKADYNTRRAKAAPLEMDSGGVVSGGKASVEVQINKIDTVSGSLYIRYVLMENGVTEGSDSYNHVVREIIEEPVSSSDFPVSKQKEFTIKSGWNAANLDAAIFVQTGSNGEVLQSKYEDFNGPLNQPPIVSNPTKTTHTIMEDVEDTTLDLKTIFSDPESDSLTFTSDATEDSNVQVTISPSGVATLKSKLNWNGEQDVIFSATDSTYHEPVPHTIKIIVQPVNDPPTATEANLDIVMLEDKTDDSINLNTVFTDIDGDTMTFSVSGDEHLKVTISADGSVTIDTSGEFHGQETLTFTATDPAGATGTKEVMITVKSHNDMPVVANPIEDFSINEDEVDTSIDLTTIYLDPDGDLLFFTYDKNANIGVNIDNDGLVTLTPRKDWNGVETITFKATDKLSTYVSEDVEVTVLPVNDPPIPDDIFELYIYEDEEYSHTFTATDIEGDSITFETNIRSIVKGLEKGKNYLFDESTGELTITATNEMVGEYTLKLTVKDDGSPPATSEPMEFTLYIENTNDNPTDVQILQPTPGATFEKGKLITFHGSADDPDLHIPESSETLIYQWESDKVIGVIGTGEQIAKVLEPGEHKIKLKVYDSTNAFSEVSLTITVQGDTITDVPEKESQDKESGSGINTLWWLIVAIVVIVVVVLLVTLSFMRKKKPQLTPEEQQLQAYYDQLQQSGMLEPMQPQYGYGYPQQNLYGAYPQQMYPQTTYPQQMVVQPQVAPPQPQAAQVLAQPSTATQLPQLPPAKIQPTPTPTPTAEPKPEYAHLPKTKPVTTPTPTPEPVNVTEQQEQLKDWNWDY